MASIPSSSSSYNWLKKSSQFPSKIAMPKNTRRKVYVVFRGREPGFYYSWPECQQQVDGFSGAMYSSFTSMEEAHSEWLSYWGRNGPAQPMHPRGDRQNNLNQNFPNVMVRGMNDAEGEVANGAAQNSFFMFIVVLGLIGWAVGVMSLYVTTMWKK